MNGTIELRPYQHALIHDLRQGFAEKHVRQVVGLPTGAGKTIVAAAIAQLAKAKGRTAAFLVERTTLIRQTVRAFESAGLTVGVIWTDRGVFVGDEDVVVASTQTLASTFRRTGRLPEFGMFIIDECHMWHAFHQTLVTRWDAVPVIGLSATPMRKGLGKYFTRLVRGPSIAELIADGYLVGFKCYGPSEPDLKDVRVRAGDFVESDLSQAMNTKELIGDLISTWERLGQNRPTIVFAVDIAHSKAITDAFTEAGHLAMHIDCHTKEDERDRIYAAFRAGEVKILSSVAVLSLGFDVPIVSCVVLARPTMSEALFIQQCGRGTRLSEAKQECFLLDHAGNCARFGLPQNFLIPGLSTGKEDARGKAKKKTKRETDPCSECGYMLEPKDAECPECGHSRRRGSSVTHTDGHLISLDGGTNTFPIEDRKRFYLELRWYAISRGWSDGWSYHKFLEKFSTKPPFAWKDLDPEPTSPETHRWIKSRMIAWAKGGARKPAPHKPDRQSREDYLAAIPKCAGCGSHTTRQEPGSGPHGEKIVCATCGKFQRWLPKAYSQVATA